MKTELEIFNQSQLKKEAPDIRPGDTVRIHQKIPSRIAASRTAGEKEKGKGKGLVSEGLVIAKKHGKGISGTITIRRVISGVGVEKVFPIHSPNIEKIEIVKRGKVRRAKLYYLREAKGRKARLKRKEFVEAIAEEEPKESKEEKPAQEKETGGKENK